MFSIIICTYNPNQAIIQQLFNAVLNFDNGSPDHEIVIVDNNSKPVLKENELIKAFLAQKPNAKIVTENTPGLTAARIAGIKESKNDWIVFFDDDNEPALNYLSAAAAVIEKYVQVGILGPGKLDVIYYKGDENNFLQKVKWLFQQRNYEGTHFDNNDIEGSEYYPFGTGMICRKDILEQYVQRIETGIYTLTDRKGKSLSSAGDIQILFTGLQMGYFAGSCSSLRLNHLIAADKTGRKNINKLVYALNSSPLKAYNEVFPERKFLIPAVTNLQVFKTLMNVVRTARLHRQKYTLSMLLCRKLGELNARLVAGDNLKKPVLMKFFEKMIDL